MAKKKPKLPSLEDAGRTWHSLASGPQRMARAYEAAIREAGYDEDHNLYRLAEMYEAADHFEDLLALARVMIDEGLDLDAWHPNLVIALLGLGRVDEAEAAMPILVGTMGYDDAFSLIVAIEYHLARKEHDTATMLFHAGWKWVPYFKGTATDRGVKPDKSLKPADLAPRFLAWLDRWTGIATGDLTKMPSFEAFGGWLDTLGAKLGGDRLEAVLAEERRREALVATLGDAKNEADAKKILDRVAWFVTPIMMRGNFLASLSKRAPKTTFALLAQARANQRLSKHAGMGEEAVMLQLALSVPGLTKQLRVAYETAIRTGTAVHDQHVDRARAALRLGLRDAALGHIESALHYLARYYGGGNPIKAKRARKQIHGHAEFKKLVGDEAFEALFQAKQSLAK